jgi:hypothetical protein
MYGDTSLSATRRIAMQRVGRPPQHPGKGATPEALERYEAALAAWEEAVADAMPHANPVPPSTTPEANTARAERRQRQGVVDR